MGTATADERALAFCGRCGERQDLCVCFRSGPARAGGTGEPRPGEDRGEDRCRANGADPWGSVREGAYRVHGEALRAAKAIEAKAGQRSPAAAAVLSFVIPGLGQLYNGEPLKAVLFFLGWALVIPWALAVLDAYYAARVSNLEARLAALEPEGPAGI